MARVIDRSLKQQQKQSRRDGALNFCGFCSLIFTILIVITIVFGFVQFQNLSAYSSSKTLNDKPVQFEVKEGESLSQITSRMVEVGIIEDKYVFFIPTSSLYLQFNNVSTENIQAGIHEIPAHAPITEVYNYLQLKDCEQFKVTIKEGLRIEEFAEKIDSALEGKSDKKFDSNEFITIAHNYKNINNIQLDFAPPSNLEGYLFPDTYNFCNDVTAQQAVDRLLKTFNDKVYAEIANDVSLKNLNLNDIIIKASLVEREAFNNDERKVIAGIIENRLENDISLGIDASSQYSAGYSATEQTWWPKDNDLVKQLNVEEPYNLRKNLGLPPTPIAAPSLNSVLAVVNPTNTDYFYYLHDDCGGIHYAKTLDQHNVNKSRYVGTGRC